MRSEHTFISSTNNEYFLHFHLIFAFHRISEVSSQTYWQFWIFSLENMYLPREKYNLWSQWSISLWVDRSIRGSCCTTRGRDRDPFEYLSREGQIPVVCRFWIRIPWSEICGSWKVWLILIEIRLNVSCTSASKNWSLAFSGW